MASAAGCVPRRNDPNQGVQQSTGIFAIDEETKRNESKKMSTANKDNKHVPRAVGSGQDALDRLTDCQTRHRAKHPSLLEQGLPACEGTSLSNNTRRCGNSGRDRTRRAEREKGIQRTKRLLRTRKQKQKRQRPKQERRKKQQSQMRNPCRKHNGLEGFPR